MLGLYILVFLFVYTSFAIAMWRIFSRAGKPGRWGIIPILNIFLLWPLAGQRHLLKYALICLGLSLLLGVLGLNLFSRLCSLGLTVLLFIMNYSLAQNFGWRKSASCLFAISYGIGYFVLGFFNDEYIGYTGVYKNRNKAIIDDGLAVNNGIIYNDIATNSVSSNVSSTNNLTVSIPRSDISKPVNSINIDGLTPVTSIGRPSNNEDNQ